MPRAFRIPGITLFAVLSAAASFAAMADVTVQERGTLSISHLSVHTASTQKVATDKQRVESQQVCDGPGSSSCSDNTQIDIVRLDRGVVWSLDQKKKRYAEKPFLIAKEPQASAEGPRSAADKLKSCPAFEPAAIDISKCELTEPKSSMEITAEVATIAGHEAKRTNLKLVQTCKTADPSQACEVSYAFDVWLASADIAGLAERDAFQRRYYPIRGSAIGLGTPAQIDPYLAPYGAAINRLVASSEQLKGLPLKSTFRVTFTGQSCDSLQKTAQIGGHNAAIAGANDAAAQATSSSTQHAANWETADALQRSTGNSVAGYVAGSAAGAFTGSLVSGLFAKKAKPQQPATLIASNSTSPPAAILLEFTLETVALSSESVPAEQFEPPPQFAKSGAAANRETELANCVASTHSRALR